MLIEAPLTSIRDRMLLIRALPSFDGTELDAVAMLAEHSRIRTFRAGEVVLREGEPVQTIFLVLDGQITSRRAGVTVGVVSRPNGVGLISVFTRDTGVHAVADVDTQTLEIPASVVLAVMEENFSMYRNRLAFAAKALVKKRGNLPARPDKPPPFALGEYREEPLTLVEIALQIRSGDGLFKNCNLDALYDVARQSREVRMEAGEVLWRVGEPSTWWLRIDHGRVRCSADGVSVDLGSGYVLGIMDGLGQVPRSCEARAETRVVAYRTDLEAFLAILENHFTLARDLLAIVSRSLLTTPEVPTTQRPPPPG